MSTAAIAKSEHETVKVIYYVIMIVIASEEIQDHMNATRTQLWLCTNIHADRTHTNTHTFAHKHMPFI